MDWLIYTFGLIVGILSAYIFKYKNRANKETLERLNIENEILTNLVEDVNNAKRIDDSFLDDPAVIDKLRHKWQNSKHDPF